MKAYRIKDWAEHYETSESKKIKNLKWVAVPLKHAGKSFRRIMAMKNASDVFSCFILIVQVGALMPERGLLVDRDGALTTEDLFFKTGMSEIKFREAIDVLASDKIGWLEIVELQGNGVIEVTENLPVHPEKPAGQPENLGCQPEKSCLQDRTGQDRTLPNKTKPAAEKSASSFRDLFSQWYEVYPRKTARKRAEKAFPKAMQEIAQRHDTPETAFLWLLDVTRVFAESPKGKGQYVPHPATWLNDANYDDDQKTWEKNDAGKSGGDRLTGFVGPGDLEHF